MGRTNVLTIRPERLERLRQICLALPEATEKVAWGDPTWRVRDKIFAMQKGNYEDGRPSLWLKGAEGAQATLVAADPTRFFVPPYVGSKGWIGLYLDARSVEWSLVKELVGESYRLIAPARLRAELEGTPRGGRSRQQPPKSADSAPRGRARDRASRAAAPAPEGPGSNRAGGARGARPPRRRSTRG